jgi:hypothetical protein
MKEVIKAANGELSCPSCNLIVGDWNWDGALCVPGAKIKPAFRINKGMLVELNKTDLSVKSFGCGWFKCDAAASWDAGHPPGKVLGKSGTRIAGFWNRTKSRRQEPVRTCFISFRLHSAQILVWFLFNTLSGNVSYLFFSLPVGNDTVLQLQPVKGKRVVSSPPDSIKPHSAPNTPKKPNELGGSSKLPSPTSADNALNGSGGQHPPDDSTPTTSDTEKRTDSDCSPSVTRRHPPPAGSNAGPSSSAASVEGGGGEGNGGKSKGGIFNRIKNKVKRQDDFDEKKLEEMRSKKNEPAIELTGPEVLTYCLIVLFFGADG